jgi:uncharacterized membrane protein (UPF0127 family)
MKTRAIIVGVAILALATISFWQITRQTTFQAAESQTLLGKTNVSVGSSTFAVEVATTPEQLAKGLSSRTALNTKTGMLFVFSPAEQATFWMKDMNFSLDLVWIKNGKVTDITRDVQPPAKGAADEEIPTFQAKEAIDYVLEISPKDGESLNIGDAVTISKIEVL